MLVHSLRAKGPSWAPASAPDLPRQQERTRARWVGRNPNGMTLALR